MSVNCQFFGKICIRVTPADQFNNRIRGWVYWGLFLGRSVRWKNWGKIERGEMGANGRRGLRGRREMQLNIDQNIPVIRFANHLLSQWSRSNVELKCNMKQNVSLLLNTSILWVSFYLALPFHLHFTCDPSKLRLSGLLCVCVSLAGLGLSELSLVQVQELAAPLWHKWYLVLRPDP